jgi:hypothetical protein
MEQYTPNTDSESVRRVTVIGPPFLTVILAILASIPLTYASDVGPKVVVILVDGLPASALSAETTPNLDALSKTDHATRWRDGRAVMPSVTNANHAALLTGTYPEANGITGNYFWSREGAPRSQPLNRPEEIDVETIFTIAEHERPALVTASITGKAKLERLFAAAPPFQLAPDYHWSDAALGEFPIDGRFGTDERTMTEALRVFDRTNPDFLFIALPEVDLVSHAAGPASPEARRAIAGADRLVGLLVDHLRQSGTWQRTIVFVTADHGFADLTPSDANPHPALFFGQDLARRNLADRVVVVSEGVLLHIYLRELAANSTVLDGPALETARQILALVRATPEIESVLTRLPWTGSAAVSFPEPLPPDWKLNHARAGDLILVAKPGHHFVDPFSRQLAALAGNHGGPRERPIPILVAGGHPALRAGPARVADHAENPDIGRTVLKLLDLRGPNSRRGGPVPQALCGRILSEALSP